MQMIGSEVSISAVKCSWVKCSEVLQCSGVLLFFLLFIFIAVYIAVCFVYFCLIL